jgi:hypothetical protein
MSRLLTVFTFILILLVIYFWYLPSAHTKDLEHEHRMNIAQNSCEYGCYAEAFNLCGMIKNDIIRGRCFDDALDKCPKIAKLFRDWLEMKEIK